MRTKMMRTKMTTKMMITMMRAQFDLLKVVEEFISQNQYES